ncbi:MAG: DNA polymerase I, partial [Oscillospiraceae bacterium]|nr:DNA polymerase I [Oscillospiraceae bacterium]
IPRYELAGFEADDLIGTISRRCEAEGWECVVATGDKDSLQLVTEKTKVKLISTRMGQTTTKDMTPESFAESYGFEPEHIVDLKALMGDTSDNIPGVAGIGEKTAMDLIGKYRSIDAIYEKLPDIEAKPGVIKKLTEGEEAARKSFYLATIVTNAPLEFSLEDNLRKAPDASLHELFLRLEFHKLIEKMGLSAAPDAPAKERSDAPHRVLAEGDEALARYRAAECVSVLALPDLTGIAVVCDGAVEEFFFDRFAGDWNGFLAALFSAEVKKASHDVKDLMRLLLSNNLPADGFAFDTALAAYLLDATAGKYDVPTLSAAYFHVDLGDAKHLESEAFSLLGDSAAAEKAFAAYASALDALARELAPKIEERELHELYYTVELPLCRVLAEMELAGVKVDAKALSDFGAEMDVQLRALETRIYEAAGGEFNINSPKQLGEVLFERLQLPHGKKTKTGWSTNADVLEKLRYEAPIVADVLLYRQHAKLKSTYCDGLLKVIAPDGRIHTDFKMTVTATGRLSSTEPNLQNIPTRTALGSELRRMFVPERGKVFVDADYSQIELRLLAHIADDAQMRRAFVEGEDIHTVTASQVFDVPVEEVTKQMRSSAKAVNFGIVYGISAFSLAQDIGVAVYEAKEYIENYLAHFAGVRDYMSAVVEKAKERGYVETLMHRRRALPELTSSQFQMRAFGERVALNMPIQGTAADIIKLAMVRVHERLKRELPEAKLILQVHDELIVECDEALAEAAAKLLAKEMERVCALSVPLVAEAHWGKNWLEAK